MINAGQMNTATVWMRLPGRGLHTIRHVHMHVMLGPSAVLSAPGCRETGSWYSATNSTVIMFDIFAEAQKSKDIN
jgi:L-2-hydroxyglutarate oxidase LhgO